MLFRSDGLLSLVKTKRYPLSRIRRLVWNAYLGVPGNLMQLPPPYVRILSSSRRGVEILSKSGRTAQLPVSHSAVRLEEKGEAAAQMIRLCARASDLYALGLPAVQPCGGDYTHKISVK